MSDDKIVPIRGKFEGMQAFLHHIANDSSAVKFCGVVWHADGSAQAVHFECTHEQMAFAAAMLLKKATG